MRSITLLQTALVGFSLSLFSLATSADVSALTLKNRCDYSKSDLKDNEAYADAMSCISYLKGYIDSATYLAAINKAWDREELAYCGMPPYMEAEQARLIFLEYAKSNPNELHKSEHQMVFLALASAFSCGAKAD
jgi:hypothetical protein